MIIKAFPEFFVILLQALEEVEIMLFLERDGFVEAPGADLFLLVNVRKQVVGIHIVLVDFVEVLGHLHGHATKQAEVGVSMVKFGVDADEFEQHVDVVNQLNITPLRNGLLNGKHLGQPDVLVIDFLKP